MEFSGERFVPGQHGSIELEHMHRYLCAAKLATNKDVLDIASGEGYGSAILARAARHVTGVDISAEAVAHARQQYVLHNLDFKTGSAAAIPLADASVDLVVSFETIEHHDQHDAMLAEIKRVLRADGLLLISTPDQQVYSLEPQHANPFHVKELTRGAFDSLLRRHFAHVAAYGQRVIYGSAIVAENFPTRLVSHRKNAENSDGLASAMYLIALASDRALAPMASSLFEAAIEHSEAVAAAHQSRAESEALLEQVRHDAAVLATELADARHAAEQLRADIDALRPQAFESRLLRQKNAALEELNANLRETVAQSNAAVEALRRSWSWRLTGGLRLGSTSLRRVAGPVLPRLRGLFRPVLTPIKDLRGLGGRMFVATGEDPQFAVNPGWRRLRQGWALVTIDIVHAEQRPLRPVLFVFHGDAGSEVTSYRLPIVTRGTVRKLILLPPAIQAVRLDPTDVAGAHFLIQHVSVRQVTRLHLLWRSFLAVDRGRRQQMVAALLRCDAAALRVLVGDALTRDLEADYADWVNLYDTVSATDRAAISERVAALPWQPLISIVMPVYNPRPAYLRTAIDSVIEQLYPAWELCIADDKSTDPEIRQVLEHYARADARIKVTYRDQNGHVCAACNSAVELASGDFIALVDHDDALPPHALYMVADELNRHPDTDLIYTDEDKIDDHDRRHDPHFKTGWNRELFYSQNIVAHLGVYRTTLLRRIGGFRIGFEGSQDYDLTLRFIRGTDASRIRHIPHVLYHWRIFPGVATLSTDHPDGSIGSAGRALTEHFAVVEAGAKVVPYQKFPGWWRIKRSVPVPLPLLSLIIPTRDRLELLRAIIDDLFHATDYNAVEVIVVDNESVEPETLAYLQQLVANPRVKVIRVEGPFNFPLFNNKAADIATGAVLGFINNDIKVIHSDWLQELVAQLVQPNVGAVGAKLYYPNDTIQHAGVILGVYGVAAHSHRHLARQSIGYFGRPVLVQNVSAVTAACMIVRREVFDQVGGYSEDHLEDGYNDVDLCLKIRSAGYDIVFTPFAELYHLESVSRGQNRSPQQLARDARERRYMLDRWGEIIQNDPFYSPNLTLDAEDFGLAFPPRARKPWLDSIAKPALPAWRPLPSQNRLPQRVIATQLRRVKRELGGAAKYQGQLQEAQRCFDAAYPIDETTLDGLARTSSMIVIGTAPFSDVSTLVEALANERVVLGELVVVDTTAGIVRGAAVLDQVETWRLRLPATKVTVVSYLEQDINFAAAVQQGLAVAQHPNVWISDLDCVPLERCLEYLLKAFVVDSQAVIAGRVFSPDLVLQRADVSPELLSEAARVKLLAADSVTPLDAAASEDKSALSSGSPLRESDVFWCGIFGGRRTQLLACQPEHEFDRRFVTDAAIADFALRLARRGVKLITSAAAAVIRNRAEPLSAAAPWEAMHDWRWLIEKHRAGTCIDSDRIELVCPFHRGDLVLAVQVAAHAASLGRSIRLHTATSLLPWARDMCPELDIQAIPVPLASAEQTYPQLLAAYGSVSRRTDASPRLARCHPARSLSATDQNLLGYMLEQVGLSPDLRLPNVKPATTREQRDLASQLMQPFGRDVVFLHPVGGWGLKSIPRHLLPELASAVHGAGLQLVQVGGAADLAVEGCDGAILHDFLPSQWREIFALGRALISVDSWTAHFASILDMPQVTLYGSTHPRHVNTKAWFAEHTSASLVLGPTVSCSPCDSLTCVTFPGQTLCAGYVLDRRRLADFLASIRGRKEIPVGSGG